MIIRLLVEAQDLVLQLLAGAALPALMMPIAFIAVELVVIATMVRLVGTLHTATDGLAALPGPTSSLR